jgi:hypothetical protein
VIIKDKNDPRSYRMNSDKLKKINFYPKKNVSMAVLELKDKYIEKKLINDPRFYSIKWLRKHLKKK